MQKSHLSVGGQYFMTPSFVHESSYLEMYSINEFQRTKNPRNSLLMQTVEKSVHNFKQQSQTDNLEKVPSLPALITQIGALSIVRGYPNMALPAVVPIINMLKQVDGKVDQSDPSEVVENFFKKLLTWLPFTKRTHEDENLPETYEQIQLLLGRMLARIRLYHPAIVDNFLEDNSAPEALRYIVQSTVIDEDLWGDFLIGRWGTVGVRIVFAEPIRKLLWSIFEYSTNAKSLADWINKSIADLVNFVYGEPIF
jgi:hypothetical protein